MCSTSSARAASPAWAFSPVVIQVPSWGSFDPIAAGYGDSRLAWDGRVCTPDRSGRSSTLPLHATPRYEDATMRRKSHFGGKSDCDEVFCFILLAFAAAHRSSVLGHSGDCGGYPGLVLGGALGM